MTTFDDPGAVEGGFDFGGFFGGLLKTGADLGKDYLKGTPKPAPQQLTQAPAPAPQQPGWTKWAIIGGAAVVLLLVAGLVFRK